MFESLKSTATRVAGDLTLRQLLADCRRLLSERGEANSVAIARSIMARYDALPDAQRAAFFDRLAADFSPDPDAVLQSAREYALQPNAEHLVRLARVTEAPRQELFRRINRAPGGTGAVVRLRSALLDRLASRPELRATEADLFHLLSSWFNPGFLQLQRVDWNSPAQLLEQIIHHEAVHAIDGWDDLRRRLQPDRRCFAFFHPQLPGEPLIFVEVALLDEMPAAVAPLIDKRSPTAPAERAKLAAFYSISNCQPGLRGVSLGNFLIKRVAEELQRELPQVKTFCTLSPIPGFATWLGKGEDFALWKGLKGATFERLEAARSTLAGAALPADADALAALDAPPRDALLTLAAAYLVHASPTASGDPVARFHLDNGARLERLNWAGNVSRKGLKQSFGLMVNYLYDLHKIESFHEKFMQGEVAHSRAVAALL
jgi:malonyl-CoA decarboxylase